MKKVNRFFYLTAMTLSADWGLPPVNCAAVVDIAITVYSVVCLCPLWNCFFGNFTVLHFLSKFLTQMQHCKGKWPHRNPRFGTHCAVYEKDFPRPVDKRQTKCNKAGCCRLWPRIWDPHCFRWYRCDRAFYCKRAGKLGWPRWVSRSFRVYRAAWFARLLQPNQTDYKTVRVQRSRSRPK